MPDAPSFQSRKITHYLLSTAHRDGQHKAAFFRSFGFKLEAWEGSPRFAEPRRATMKLSKPFPRHSDKTMCEGRCPRPMVARRECAWFGLLPIDKKLLHWPRHIHWMNDMIKELDSVVLTTDLPEHGLAKDDIGTVVLVHEGGKGCTVEFMTLAGKTIAVVTLLADQIRQIAKDEIAHARHVAATA